MELLDYPQTTSSQKVGMQLARSDDMEHYLVAPDPAKVGLTRHVVGTDHTGAETALSVVEERPLTIFLNRQEIVTAMTIGDYPEYLALGFFEEPTNVWLTMMS